MAWMLPEWTWVIGLGFLGAGVAVFLLWKLYRSGHVWFALRAPHDKGSLSEARGEAAVERGAGFEPERQSPGDPRFKELERQVRELSTLNRVIRSVNYRLNLQQILNEALHEVVSGLDLSAGAVYLRSGDQMLLGAVIGIPADLQTAMERLGPDQVRLLLEQKSVSSEHDCHLAPFLGKARSHGLLSWLALPLSTRELQAGILLLSANSMGRFGEDEIAMVSSIANQISIAIENASLLQETLRSLRRLEAMNRASQAVNASLDLHRVQEQIAGYACELASADAAGVFEFLREKGALRLASGFNLPPDVLEETRWLTEQTAVENDPILHMMISGETVEIADLRTVQGSTYADGLQTQGLLSMLVIPMLKADVLVGVISTWWRRPHRAPMDVVAMLTTLANQSVSAIENARLNTFNEQIVRSMDEGILIENADGYITFANQAVAEMMGYDHPEELVHQRVLSWIDVRDRFAARQQHNAVLAGERRRFEATFRRKDGQTIPVLASSTLLSVGSGHEGTILMVLTDLSPIKDLQQRLLQTEKLSALGELVAGVAHELNNPLTSIIGYSRLIQAHGPDNEVQEDLNRIMRQAQRAAEIVRNLLAFARQEIPCRQTVDVNDLIERTLALRSYELRVENIQVATDLDETLPTTMADPLQLQQVFLNLILNAEQAMVDSGVGRQLHIRSWWAGSMIEIEVTDDGPGIPPALIGRIFDPFVTSKEQGKGTGLGLSISYGIIQEHGGKIWAESEGIKGKGSRFRLLLPVINRDAESVAGSIEPSQPSEAHAPARLSRAQILLIDDEKDIVEMISRVLEENGYKVEVAMSGSEALVKIAANRFLYDLVVCDIKMPGMSGFELYNLLKERYPSIVKRIVFVTGDVAGEKTSAFLRRTGIPALRKPFEVEELLSFIREALTKHQDSYPIEG